ncbi:MAG TPA: hypothetical protein VMU31_10465 [Rhizomicrobium sp.]|nr:hypothetical protein [Rhizomicrobium sp.]
MKKVQEFRRRAADCRDQAAKALPELRCHYAALADMWDRLADERVTFFIPKDEDGQTVAQDFPA